VVPSGTTLPNPFVRLDVTSVRNPPPSPSPLTGSSGQVTFVFGQQQAPQTITFALSSLIGVTGNMSSITVPLHSATPTGPIEGISYNFRGFKPGEYAATLSWADSASNNRGWTASFGGAPGTGTWPKLTMTITVATAGAEPAPQKVAILGAPGAQANTLRITIRSNSNPSADYGIHNQGVVPGTVI
jgi:hypothetical protein